MKKLIATIVSILLIVSVCPLGLFTLTASAETSGIYTYSVSNGEATITGCDSSISGEIIIPDTLGGYPVTSIGGCAFEECTGLTSITIPDSVIYIGSQAFAGCMGLTSITIPDSVTSILNWAFANCDGLTSITIPDTVTFIGYNAFGNTAWYNNQPDGLVYVGKVAYRYKGICPASVTIQDGTLGIAGAAFSDMGLTSITIPDGVTSIGDGAFSGCTGLISVTIPDSVSSIGRNAFSYCTGLTSVTIPESVTAIGISAFEDCRGLTSITIPNSVTSIGGYGFYGCTGLTDVYYAGTEEQKNKISFESGNGDLLNATWHYNWVEPQFTTHSLVLTGEIGVNFFVDLDALTEEEKEATYMTFTVGGEPGRKAYYNSAAVNDSGKYRFTCFVSSVHMAETIVPTLHYKDGQTVTGEPYSVKQYIDYVVENSGSFPEKVVTLVKALGDYGHYSQSYLKEQHPELDFTALSKYREGDFASYAGYLTALSGSGMAKDIADTAVSGVTYNLNLDSTITVNIKLSAGESLNASGTFDGRVIAGEETEDITLVHVAGIPIKKLGETITVTGTGSTNGAEYTVTLSGLSYIRAILNKPSSSKAAKNAMAALYEYYLAAVAY